jgi:hypothetical protein
MLKVDFSTVENKEFEPVPTGVYNAIITGAEVRDSKSGNQYINWTFEIQDDPVAGRLVWGMTSLVQSALFKLQSLLAAIGMECDGEIDFDPDDAIGKVLRIQVEQDNYEGKLRNKVDKYMSAD